MVKVLLFFSAKKYLHFSYFSMKAWVLIRRDPIYLDTPVIKSFLFSGKNKKNIVNLSSAKFAQRVVNIDVFIFSSISQKKKKKNG